MRFARNASWNVAEVLISSVVLFILYKVVVARLGVEAVGIWSLVLATTSLARFADIGAAGGLARYIGLAEAGEAPAGGAASQGGALVYARTAWTLNFGLYAILSALVIAPAYWGLGLVTEGAATATARQLLPYAIVSFFTANLTGIVTSALVGFHRSYLKSQLVIGAIVAQAAVALVLFDRFGLRAVAIGQIVQNLAICLIGWPLVVRVATGRSWLAMPFGLNRIAVRELVGFGLRLQAVNLASFLFEPATKFVFSAVGGLHALGIFEMASRLVLQLRQFLVMPSQNLIPMFAESSVRDRGRIRLLYGRAVATIGSLALAGLAALTAASPFIAYVWLGHVDALFVFSVAVLSVGWLVNILTVPAYLLGAALGRLRWNLVGAAVTTIVGPLAGIVLGRLVGPEAIVVAAAGAIIAGGLVVLFRNTRDAGIAALPRRSDFADLKGEFRKLLQRRTHDPEAAPD